MMDVGGAATETCRSSHILATVSPSLHPSTQLRSITHFICNSANHTLLRNFIPLAQFKKEQTRFDSVKPEDKETEIHGEVKDDLL